MRTKNCCAQGFTLIELLVVVLIIGILAAIALPQYQKTVEKSRVSEAKTNLRALLDAAAVYSLSHSEFTFDLTDLDIAIAGEYNDDNTQLITKNWTYLIDECLGSAGLDDCVIAARRNNSSYGDYEIDIAGPEYDAGITPNRFACFADEAVCKKLGAVKDGDHYYFN